MRYHLYLNNENLTPKQALDVLIEGNNRFLNSFSTNRDFLRLVSEDSMQQFPFAAILSCSDSRVPTEIIFDQGLGDVFSVRLAGNIASLKAIASIEYACKYLGSKIIVVLGHTKCGGVAGTCDGIEMGNLNAIFSDIRPAVSAEKTIKENRTSQNEEFLNKVIHHNVELQMMNILQSSSLIRDMIAQEKVGLAGAYYDLDTGGVHFYEEDKVFDMESQSRAIQNIIAGY